MVIICKNNKSILETLLNNQHMKTLQTRFDTQISPGTLSEVENISELRNKEKQTAIPNCVRK